MKAILVLYDGLCELDRTEVTYQTERQLKDIILSSVSDYPDTELAEVYNASTNKMIVAYGITSKGNLTTRVRYKCRTITVGRPKVYTRFITFSMPPNLYQTIVKAKTNISAYIRKAIEEKLQRDGRIIPPAPPTKRETNKQQKEYENMRYHRMLGSLPPFIIKRDNQKKEVTREPLTINRTFSKSWRASYGPFSSEKDAPSFECQDLLSAVELLGIWVTENKAKWVIEANKKWNK